MEQLATNDEIREWIHDYDRDWNGQAQALMFQLARYFGTVVSTPPSALAAFYTEKSAVRIERGTPPPGSFVYFDIGTDGHVGFILDTEEMFHGSVNCDEFWGVNAGVTTIQEYVLLTDARVLGWSWRNGGNRVRYATDLQQNPHPWDAL